MLLQVSYAKKGLVSLLNSLEISLDSSLICRCSPSTAAASSNRPELGGGAKMKEELVQTKENANAEAALLNAQILSLQNMCAEQ